MPSTGIEPVFQASEAYVLSVAPRGHMKDKRIIKHEFHYMSDFICLQVAKLF